MKRLLAVCVLSAALVGCAARPIHPGAANSFDSHSYDALIVTHSVIESTKADIAANSIPVTLAPNVKKALNDLINGYNIADSAYLIYHAAALAGNATSAQGTALTQALSNVNSQTATLAAAKAGN